MGMTEHDETMEDAFPVAMNDGEETASPVNETEAEENPYAREAKGMKAFYPDFDWDRELSHPVMGEILRGEEKPSLKQLYEAVHLEEILEERVSEEVSARLSEAVTTAVETALREHERNMLAHIRARGQRPSEMGVRAASGIRMHPAVERLTRRERALLAKRAEDGEEIRF